MKPSIDNTPGAQFWMLYCLFQVERQPHQKPHLNLRVPAMKKRIVGLSILLLTLQVFAVEKKDDLNVDDIIKDGYQQMSGDEIRSHMFGKTLVIKDLQAKSKYEGELSKTGATKVKQTQEVSPSMLTNIEYQSRAPLLASDNISIKGNKIVATDGLRTFSSRIYIKGETMLGVRDIDNGRVYLQITVKK